MYRAMRWYSFVAIVSIVLSCSLVLAEGKAKERGNKPPGWEKGEKKGWKSDVPPGIEKKGGWMPPGLSKEEQTDWKDGIPPGWEKWTNQKKKGWKKELGKAKENVHKRAKKLKNFSKEDLDKALLSVEAAARKGIPIKYAQGLVEKAMEKDIKGKGFETASRAMAYGVGKEIDFDQLGKFVHKKLDKGLRDDKLSIEIYKEITKRHEERLKAKKAIR